MNIKFFGHIYNFFTIISIKENIDIIHRGKHDPIYKNDYVAEYYVRFLGNDFYTREYYSFSASNEVELEEKKHKITNDYEIFKSEFLKFNPSIININNKT